MLTCKSVAEQASQYVDGEMSLLKRAQFKLHLVICKHCQNFVSNFNLGIQMIRCLPREEVSPEQLEVVKAQVKARLEADSVDGRET